MNKHLVECGELELLRDLYADASYVKRYMGVNKKRVEQGLSDMFDTIESLNAYYQGDNVKFEEQLDKAFHNETTSTN